MVCCTTRTLCARCVVCVGRSDQPPFLGPAIFVPQHAGRSPPSTLFCIETPSCACHLCLFFLHSVRRPQANDPGSSGLVMIAGMNVSCALLAGAKVGRVFVCLACSAKGYWVDESWGAHNTTTYKANNKGVFMGCHAHHHDTHAHISHSGSTVPSPQSTASSIAAILRRVLQTGPRCQCGAPSVQCLP